MGGYQIVFPSYDYSSLSSDVLMNRVKFLDQLSLELYTILLNFEKYTILLPIIKSREDHRYIYCLLNNPLNKELAQRAEVR